MMTMQEIEKLAREYVEANGRLMGHVRNYNDGVEAARRKYLPAIRINVSRMEDARRRLHNAIEESPELFDHKKTAIFHGVRVGFKKMKGKVWFASRVKVVALIKKHFPEMARTLIRVEEKPNKDTLVKLSAADLKRLGVEITEDGEAPYIKLVDREGEKLVKEFLKGFEKGNEAA